MNEWYRTRLGISDVTNASHIVLALKVEVFGFARDIFVKFFRFYFEQPQNKDRTAALVAFLGFGLALILSGIVLSEIGLSPGGIIKPILLGVGAALMAYGLSQAMDFRRQKQYASTRCYGQF
jgi:hypothetical protein